MMMSNCVYESFTIEDFEEKWKKMIITYNLEKNEWLESSYNVCELWVPVYLKSTYVVGM